MGHMEPSQYWPFSLCSLAGQYDKLISTWLLALIDCSKMMIKILVRKPSWVRGRLLEEGLHNSCCDPIFLLSYLFEELTKSNVQYCSWCGSHLNCIYEGNKNRQTAVLFLDPLFEERPHDLFLGWLKNSCCGGHLGFYLCLITITFKTIVEQLYKVQKLKMVARLGPR
jgi:hypothetical protein